MQQTLIIAVDDARLADGFDIAVKQPRERITVVSRDPREQATTIGRPRDHRAETDAAVAG